MLERTLTHRKQLAELCNEAGLKTALEVGTHQGVFADELLSVLSADAMLYCVDSWEHDPVFPELKIYAPCFIEQALGRQFDEAVARLVLTTKYKDRVNIIKATSFEASKRFVNESLGMVYIDGEHTIEAVVNDISNWWPKVTPGGILAGHDYVSGDHTRPGVVIAVNDFVLTHLLDLHIIQEESPSWYVRKPK